MTNQGHNSQFWHQTILMHCALLWSVDIFRGTQFSLYFQALLDCHCGDIQVVVQQGQTFASLGEAAVCWCFTTGSLVVTL